MNTRRLVAACLSLAAVGGLGAASPPMASAITTKQAVKLAYQRCGTSYSADNHKESKLVTSDGTVYGTLVVFYKTDDEQNKVTCDALMGASKLTDHGGTLHTLLIQGSIDWTDAGIEPFAKTGVRSTGTFTAFNKFGSGADLLVRGFSTVPGSETNELAKSADITIPNSD